MRRYLFFFAMDMGFTKQAARQIAAAFHEAVYNVIQHAYKGMKKYLITVEFRNHRKHIELYIRDYGIRSIRSEIVARPLDDYRTSGLGMYLMENFMDYLKYSTSCEQGTELIMVKNLYSPGSRRTVKK